MPDPNPDVSARTFLFVPANRRVWLDNAPGLGADAIVADLEDGVAESDKDEARSTLDDWLSHSDRSTAIFVRVNAGPRFDGDLAVVSGRVSGVFVPKAADPTLFDDIDLPVVAMIESASGWLAAAELAAHPAVARLAAGEQDLLGDIDANPSPDEIELLPFRMHLVVASAAAGLPSPIGPVHMRVDDPSGLRSSSERLRRMGFGGRSAIHPGQIDIINEAFAPTPDELAWAGQMIHLAEAHDEGAFVDDDGQLVDEAVIHRARRILSRSPMSTRDDPGSR